MSFTVAGSTEKFTASIYAIEPEIEIATRTLKIRASGENPDGKLIAGTFATIELPLKNIKNAIRIINVEFIAFLIFTAHLIHLRQQVVKI